MAPRRKLDCITCGTEFSTNSSNRRECYTCLPKAGTNKPFDRCSFEKNSNGITIQKEGSPDFYFGAKVTLQISREEKERVIINRPVMRTRYKKYK